MEEFELAQPGDGSEERPLLPYSEDEINNSEEMKRYLARQYGVPEGSSWDAVWSARDIHERRRSAELLGLLPDASPEEIREAAEKQGVDLFDLKLGLPRDATAHEALRAESAGVYAMQSAVAEEMRFNRAKRINPIKPLE